MGQDEIQRKALYSTLLRTCRMMKVYDFVTIANLYGLCIEQNGGSKEFVSSCVGELCVDYLDK